MQRDIYICSFRWPICQSDLVKKMYFLAESFPQCLVYLVIKSPRYTGGDFMFFVLVHTPPQLQSLVHAITSEQLFIFLGKIGGPDLYITWLDFGWFSLWTWPRIFKVKYGIRYISTKNVQLPRNKRQTYRLNSKPQMWPSDLTLAMALTLNFQGQIWNLLYLGQKWPDCHETNSKYVYWTLCLKCDLRIWAWPWLMNFQGQIRNLLNLRQRWFDYHKMKSMHIEWTEGINDHQVWLWPWLWKVRCKDLMDSGWGDFRCGRAIDSSS